jgi:DNA-binding response OmpR family regulator
MNTQDGSPPATILVVEDDARVNAWLATLLARSGYRAVTARNSNHAIAQAAAVRGPIHLLIADVTMPGGNGAQLAEKLAAGGLRAPVLFISGHLRSSLIRKGQLGDSSHFLPKPFTPADLLAKVRQLLENSLTITRPQAPACVS